MAHALAPRKFAGVLFAAAFLALSGCGDSVKLVPAEGVVKINGQPAANVSVQFLPDVTKGVTGPTSYGTTNAEGKFQLKTYDGRDGAVPGAHMVVLADLDEERPPQGQVAKKAPRIPNRFTTATGGLTAEVKDGGGPIILEVPAN